MANVHEGHRERMRKKFLRYGADPFDTYELLEMLLYHSIPIKDTNPIAKGLLSRFSSLDGVFSATREELLSVDEIGEQSADLLLAAGRLSSVSELLSSEEKNKRLDDRGKIRDCAVRYFEGRSDRAVVMFSLDNRLSLLAADEIYQKDFCCGNVRPEEFVLTAIRRKASVVVLAHNHPNAIPYPSEGDSVNELALRAKMASAGISYPLHYIVSGNKTFEFPNDRRVLHSADPSANLFEEGLSYEENRREENRSPVSEMLCSVFSAAFGRERAEEIADALIAAYPSLSHILETPPEDLAHTSGIALSEALYFRLALALFLRRTTDAFRFGRKHSEAEILDYLYARFLDRREENVFALPVDIDGKVLGEELIFIGDVSRSQILPRKILECADRYGAKAVILAHNHPSGNAEPSTEDYYATETLFDMLATFGIGLKAAYAIAGYSFSDAISWIKRSTTEERRI